MPQPQADAEIASDWKDRLITILSAPNITQPEPVAFSTPLRKLLFLCATLWLIYTVLNLAFEEFVGFEGELATLATIAYLFIVVVAGLYFCLRWGAMGRPYRMELMGLGRNPTAILRNARHPPVLFLRSFAFDNATLAPRSRSRSERLLDRFGLLRTPEMRVTIKAWDYAAVVAIGRPEEFEPPAGAARFYVSRDTWHDTIESLIPLCQLIIWTTGRTQGLRWEMQRLIGTVSPRRLLLWVHVHAEGLTAAEREREWTGFLEDYREVFPKPLPRNIADVRFVAFDDDWSPQPVPSTRYPRSLLDRDGLRPFLRNFFSYPAHSRTARWWRLDREF